jgi:hypothetical protein
MQLHLIDLAKASNKIWEELSKLFEEKAMNAKFSLKLQLFSVKMHEETCLSTHINDLMSLLRQLAETGIKVDPDDAKTINSLSSKYSNVVFTLAQLPSQTLEGMVTSLLAEEKRTYSENLDAGGQREIALYSKGKMRKTKGSTECFYCHKNGHIAWNYRARARDLLNGKESANIANLEELSESESDEEPREPSLILF